MSHSSSGAAAATESLTPHLFRASHALITLFPGDVSRGIPAVLYLPLLANAHFETSEEYRRNMMAAAASSASSTVKNSRGSRERKLPKSNSQGSWTSRFYASPSAASNESGSAESDNLAAAAGASAAAPFIPDASSSSPASPSAFRHGAPSMYSRSPGGPRASASSSSAVHAAHHHHFDPRANFLSGGFCATLTFQLEPWQSESISGLSYTNAMHSAAAIKAVLRRIREEKRKLM